MPDELNDIDFVDPTELLPHIGAVVYESSLLDELLREVALTLSAIDYSHGWLFEGQSSEWLTDSNLIVLKEVDPYNKLWDKGTHETFRAEMQQLRPLRPLRNTVVHGVWTRLHAEDTYGRPWGGAITEDAYFCARPRLRNAHDSRAFTVGDIAELAKRYRDARIRIANLAFRMFSLRYGTETRFLMRWRRWVDAN